MKTFRIFAVLLIGAVAPIAAQAGSIWFSSEKTLQQLDVDSAQVVTTLPLSEVKALAVDSKDGSVLALTEKKIHKFSANGAALLEKALSDFGLDEGKRFAVNPYDGSAWIASNKKLIRLDSQGRQLRALSALGKIRSIALALDESLWVLGEKQVWHYNPNGALIESRSLSGLSKDAKQLAVDSIARRLWIASEKQLLQFDTADLKKSPLVVSAPDEVEDLSLDPSTGTLWVLGEKKLLAYTNNVTLVKNINLGPLSIDDAEVIAYDSLNKNIWIGYKKGVANISQEGVLLTKTPLSKEIKAIGVSTFFVTPVLSLIQPPSNALTNNPKPTITLGFDAQCLGVPCGFAPTYYLSSSLSANLNDKSIGSLFSFDAGTAQSSHTPASALPEGQNTFNAQVQDRFGHASNRIESTFTIDTIAPKFLNVSPVDGSVFTVPQATVSGTIDDAQAFIVLDGLNGPVSGPNFSFPVNLNLGVNALKLSAIDKAGNQSNVNLNLTYTASAPNISVSIASPVSGAAISGDTVLVSGEFQGPANTGITVNNTVASLVGNQFYANVTLQLGANTITAVVTTPDGATTTKVVNVTSSGSSPFRITADPLEGAAPLKVSFRVNGTGANSAQRIEIDFDGNGSIDLSVNDPSGALEYIYNAPGVYTAKFVITDTRGVSSLAQAVVVVQDSSVLDKQFKAIWNGMLTKLRGGDINGALSAVSGGMKEKYRTVFTSLKSDLPAIVDQLGTVREGTIGSEIAEYVIERNTPAGPQAFQIYFLLGDDGIWRIDGM